MTGWQWIRHWFWCWRNGICWRHLTRKEHGYNWHGCRQCAHDDKLRTANKQVTLEQMRNERIRKIAAQRQKEGKC